MAGLLVLVAHSGRTLQLDVQPSTRVDAVQHALVSFTGIPVAEQIAMYQGARLDPQKMLGAYRLPVDPSLSNPEDQPVFLYCRSYLKPGAALPPPEALPPLQVQVPPLAEVSLTHPLHSAPSPLVRALPDYERHFQHHLATTRAYWDVAQARLQRCRQLLSEQEVQARAADAARANVEAHYNYILNSYQSFLDKYNAQHAAHALLLSTFPSDLAALEAIELHPSLQQQQQQQPALPAPHQQLQQIATGLAPPAAAAGGGAGGTAAGPRRLADLYPVQRLREWAETCGRSHASFAAKVAELEALFQLLRKDVEGLFMQAPSVDLDALGRQMAEHEALLDEHSSMVQVLSKDLRTVRALVEDVVRQLGSAGAGAGAGSGASGGLRQRALHDAAAAMEAIHETHRNRVLPRLAQLDGQLASFAAAVEASKVAMSSDVLGQLQRISGQQSRIRDMKNKLAAFHEVLGRQDAAFAELKVVHRLPSAYRALLAEVVRRSAWHQLYCGQAGRLAEHMSRFREKEAGRRAAFSAQVARHIPADLLVRAGLASEPPHCLVSVPPPEVPLIAVAMSDLQRLAYLDERLLAASASLRTSSLAAAATAGRAASASASHHQHPQQAQLQRGFGGAAAGAPGPAGSHHHHHHHHHQQQPLSPRHQAGSVHQAGISRGLSMGAALAGGAAAASSSSMMPFPGTVAVLDADPPPPAEPRMALEMENARLRAELANHIAAACIRELDSAAATAHPAPSEPGPQLPAAAAEVPSSRASGGGAASASTAASPQPQQAAATAVTAASVSSARKDPAELVAAMHRALGMKDDLIRQQQREAAALAARLAAYEQRVTSLEALLDQRALAEGAAAAAAAAAAGGGGGVAAGASGGVGTVTGDDHSGSQATAAEAGPASQQHRSGEDVAAAGGSAVLSRSSAPSADSGVEADGDRRHGDGAGDAGGAGDALRTAGAGGSAAGADAGSGVGRAAAAAATVGSGGTGAGFSASRSSPTQVTAEDTADATPPAATAAAAAQVGALSTRPALTVLPPEASAAGPDTGCPLSPPALSPFSLASAQQQRVLAEEEQGVPGSAAAVTQPSRSMAAEAKQTAGEGGTPGASGRCSAEPARGASGPQAIPQPAAAAMRRGGGGGSGELGPEGAARHGGDGGRLSPYDSRVPPMSIGSLPFATSLPVGSATTGRLASSPGGGIGLGLALGLGLASLAEGQAFHERGQQQRGRCGSGLQIEAEGPGGGGAGGSAGGSDSEGAGRERAEEGGEAGGAGCGSLGGSGPEQPEGEGVGGGGGGEDDGDESSSGSSSVRSSVSGSSGGLQFQPSWSAPVSGESIGGAGGVTGEGRGAADWPLRRGRAAAAEVPEEEVDGGSEEAVEDLEAGDQHRAGGAGIIAAGGPEALGLEESSVAVANAAAVGGCGAGDGGLHGDDATTVDGGARDPVQDRGPSGSDGPGQLVAFLQGAEAVASGGVEGDGAAAESPVELAAAAGMGAGGGAECSGEDDADEAAELPDIDDVIGDTDGAWEVTPAAGRTGQTMAVEGRAATGTTAAARNVLQPVPAAAEPAAGARAPAQGVCVSAAVPGAGSEGAERAKAAHDQQQERQEQLMAAGQPGLEESSGYESVGSVVSVSGESLAAA